MEISLYYHVWCHGLPFGYILQSTFSVRSKQKQMKSKQFPSEVYVLRKRVNLSSESSQLFSDETVNQIRMSKQVLKNKA